MQLDLRGHLRLGMHLRFRNPRRSQVAPKGYIILQYTVNEVLGNALKIMNLPQYTVIYRYAFQGAPFAGYNRSVVLVVFE